MMKALARGVGFENAVLSGILFGTVCGFVVLGFLTFLLAVARPLVLKQALSPPTPGATVAPWPADGPGFVYQLSPGAQGNLWVPLGRYTRRDFGDGVTTVFMENGDVCHLRTSLRFTVDKPTALTAKE